MAREQYDPNNDYFTICDPGEEKLLEEIRQGNNKHYRVNKLVDSVDGNSYKVQCSSSNYQGYLEYEMSKHRKKVAELKKASKKQVSVVQESGV